MIVRVVPLALSALLTAAGVVGMAGHGHAEFTNYDDFSGSAIDPDKWSGESVEGASVAPTARALRVIDHGSLRLALTSWGSDGSDSGSVVSRERLRMTQSGLLGGSGFITGMKATVTLLDAQTQDCAANPANATSTLAQLLGWFFNDGTGGPNNRTGNIIAGVQLVQGADGVKRIVPLFQRCQDSACNTASNNSLGGNVFTTHWALNTPLTLELLWDESSGKFTFTATNPATLATESHDFVYQGTVTNAGPPTVVGFNALDVRNNVKHCSTARKRLTIDALFDTVQVRRRP